MPSFSDYYRENMTRLALPVPTASTLWQASGDAYQFIGDLCGLGFAVQSSATIGDLLKGGLTLANGPRLNGAYWGARASFYIGASIGSATVAAGQAWTDWIQTPPGRSHGKWILDHLGRPYDWTPPKCTAPPVSKYMDCEEVARAQVRALGAGQIRYKALSDLLGGHGSPDDVAAGNNQAASAWEEFESKRAAYEAKYGCAWP